MKKAEEYGERFEREDKKRNGKVTDKKFVKGGEGINRSAIGNKYNILRTGKTYIFLKGGEGGGYRVQCRKI